MVRGILSVVVGYLVLAILVTLATSVVFVAPGFVFRTDSVEPTVAFTVWNLVMSLVGAIVGGLVCAAIAGRKRPTPVKVFAGLVLVLGLGLAVAHQFDSRPPITAEEIAHMSIVERAEHAREPVWYSFLLPFVGCAGVLMGSRLCPKQSAGSFEAESVQ
jgi:hypothetical protein